MPDDRVSRLRTSAPIPATLAIMGRTARQAAREWTMQKWAGELASEAGPRDYVGQLRRIYDDLTKKRWRYVMEPGERVPGTPRALLGYVLGAIYNCDDPNRCQVNGRDWKRRGWGDCDDVSTLVAAAALAIGMQPAWRVVRWPTGAHVSTVVQTPRGEWVSVDPVGYPDKPFGFALLPPGGRVQIFTLEGAPMGPVALTQSGGSSLGGIPMAAHVMQQPYTLVAQPRSGFTDKLRQHVVMTQRGDTRGPRVLAIPKWSARIMRQGLIIPGQRAVDQFGEDYEFLEGVDAWCPVGGYVRRGRPSFADNVAALGAWQTMGSRWSKRRAARKKKRKARRTSRRAKVRAVFAKVRKGVTRVIRKVVPKGIRKVVRRVGRAVMRSKLVRGAVATTLAAFGVPPAATRAAMKHGSTALKALIQGGKWREAASAIKSRFGDFRGFAGYGLSPAGHPYAMAGCEYMGDVEADQGVEFVMVQDGWTYTVAPVAALTGVGGVYNLGQLEVQPEPTPGMFYRAERGDTLLRIAGRAFGLGSGGERTAAAKMISEAQANACFLGPTDAGSFEQRLFGPQITYLRPNWASGTSSAARCSSGGAYPLLWIPPAAGVEPPEAPTTPEEAEPEPPIVGDNCEATGGTTGPDGQCIYPPSDPIVVPALPEDEPDLPPETVPTLPPVTVDPEPVAPPVTPVEPVAPPIETQPVPAPPPITPADEQPEAGDETSCPPWFFESPTLPGACRPVVAPGGPGCPPGMVWSENAGAGTGDQRIGGCIPAPSPIPDPEPMPTPTPRPAPVTPAPTPSPVPLDPSTPGYPPSIPDPEPMPTPGPSQPQPGKPGTIMGIPWWMVVGFLASG